MATTTLTNSFREELLQGGHNFTPTLNITGNTTSGSTSVTSVSSVANITVGASISGTGIAAGAVVAAVPSSTSLTLSQAATATGSAVALSVTGDVFQLLLIKPGATGVYDATLTNVGTPGTGTPSTSNVGTDMVSTSGTGYSIFTLTSTQPLVTGGVAYWTPAVNPNWASATFSATAAVLFNSSTRLGGVAGRTVGVFDLGGTQTVSGGTFTLVLPTDTNSAALVRIS